MPHVLPWIALICLLGGAILLITLSYVDIKSRLLPNEMILGFLTLGLVFHLVTLASFVTAPEIFMGGALGFSTLFLIRAAANHFYHDEALGLGDVKLMGAAGLWLGPENLMLAMVIGATASLFHGIFYGIYASKKSQGNVDYSRISLPAGPGFAVGIFLAACWTFRDFVAA